MIDRSLSSTRPFIDPVDRALLAAFLVMAALGTATRCLMVNDGAVFVAAIWFGETWDLHFSQLASRAVSILLLFGPAWVVRSLVNLPADAFVLLAHVLYFAVPLVLWWVIRAVEPHPSFSRLYLANSLMFIYFPTELIVGIGLWMVWAAIIASADRPRSQIVGATIGLGIALVFTHPATILMTVLYGAVGTVLSVTGRPFPRRSAAFLAMIALLCVGYVATSRFLPATNPTAVRAMSENSRDFIDPWWMLATIGRSPVLLALWLLLLVPGTNAARLRWRASSSVLVAVGLLGLWFAVNGVSQVTWIYVRHAGVHVLALAQALALAAPAAAWLAEARGALGLFAAVAVAAALSYNLDLALLQRFVEAHLKPGYVDAESLSGSSAWPPQRPPPSVARVAFKWTAGADYVRDVVVPDYDWYLVTLAFQSFFLSDRTSVLFHRLSDSGWIVFECPPVRRALDHARDARDATFLRFVLDSGYCVR
jgi:hypothetical protein